jgi:hypothetical protein
MFKVLVIQAQNNLSDDRAEFLINDRLSFMRFILLESLRGQVSAFFRHPASCPSAVVFSGCRRTIDWHQPHKRSKDGPYSD